MVLAADGTEKGPNLLIKKGDTKMHGFTDKTHSGPSETILRRHALKGITGAVAAPCVPSLFAFPQVVRHVLIRTHRRRQASERSR
jgi:hypothetical protein